MIIKTALTMGKHFLTIKVEHENTLIDLGSFSRNKDLQELKDTLEQALEAIKVFLEE